MESQLHILVDRIQYSRIASHESHWLAQSIENFKLHIATPFLNTTLGLFHHAAHAQMP
jgi:hypothetical protein